MKNISPQLLALLQSTTKFNRADLYQINLPNGQTLYANNSNVDILWGAPLQRYYSSLYGAWSRGSIVSEATFKASSNSSQVFAYIPNTVLFPGTSVPFMQVLVSGLLDGAQITITQIFWEIGQLPSVATIVGSLVLYVGQVANISQTGRSKVTLDVADLLYILNRPMPPNYLQTGCRHTLYNANCTANQASFTISAAVAANSNQLNLNFAASYTAGIYLQGTITFTSGQNKGITVPIKNQTLSGGVTTMLLGQLLPFPVATGDTCNVSQGCDKTIPTCQNRFNNLIHFGGTPYVPNPETAAG